MPWSHQATSNYLNTCWSNSMMPYNITRPQWVHWHILQGCFSLSQIAKFMGPTWGPPGSCRPQTGPIWSHEPCYLGCNWLSLGYLVPWIIPLPPIIWFHFWQPYSKWQQVCKFATVENDFFFVYMHFNDITIYKYFNFYYPILLIFYLSNIILV